MNRLLTTAFCAFAAMSGSAQADSAALLMGNEDYANFRDVLRGDEVVGLERALSRAGVDVTVRRDAILSNVQSGIIEFENNASGAETLIVALGGRFVHTDSETYFLPPGAVVGPVGTLAWRSVPLSSILAILGENPGDAVLLLGTDNLRQDVGRYLTTGIGQLDIPQGVTVVAGEPRALANFAAETIAQPGRTFVDVARSRGFVVAGFAPDDLVLLDPPVRQETTTTRPLEYSRARDFSAWGKATQANTIEAYRQYLEEQPSGEFVRMAESRIQSLTDTPEARAERTEQSLDLNREARREIQRSLKLLGYEPRGIDGIFGRGTRSAISAWQSDQGIRGYGFLDRPQLERMSAQAAQRAQELERQAEQRRRQLLAEDRAFWAETGAQGDEQGLRAYLRRYPDGEFADAAQTRLGQIEDQKRRRANARDRSLWDQAANINTLRAYREYLQQSPSGAFRNEAEARIARIQQRRQNSNSEAARAEDAMGLSSGTKRLIEARLNALGLEPGAVDGSFDNATRRAIRRYQRANEIDQTGYLSEGMVVQLMAGAVRSIFR